VLGVPEQVDHQVVAFVPPALDASDEAIENVVERAILRRRDLDERRRALLGGRGQFFERAVFAVFALKDRDVVAVVEVGEGCDAVTIGDTAAVSRRHRDLAPAKQPRFGA
jgi:hypothetical protein